MKLIGLFTISSLLACSVGTAQAQETDLTGKIAVELNAVETADTACTLTFMITNGLDQQIDSVVYETVLIDTDGKVDRLTLFDFGELPVARPRVRQFAVPDMACGALGRILFNGANSCQGVGIEGGVCAAALVPTSRNPGIEVLG